MARLSINEITTFRWTFEEDVARYVRAGVPAIGVWRQKLSDCGEERGIDLLAESGLAVSNLLWAGGFTGSDGRTFRESIDDAEEAIRLAAAMQAGCLIVYGGARHLHTHNHARRLLRGALLELSAIADDMDVTLAVEPMHEDCAEDWTILTSVGDALETLSAIGSPRIKLAFDTYHFGRDRNAVSAVAAAADRVAIVHLADGKEPPRREQSRCPLGAGSVPLREIVSALAAAGYDGDYDVELMGEEIENADYDALLAHTKRTFEDLVA